MSVFTKQTYLVISIDTGIDLSGADDPKILYQKANGSRGSWNAQINGTKLEYQVLANDIGVAGTWKFQPLVTIDGKRATGQIVTQNFLAPLDQ